jgi:excisionase family DNA binding protein
MKAVLLSVPEAAEMLGLKPKGMWGLIGRREIESCKIGRLRKISIAAIEAYIAERTIPARQRVV